MPANRKAIVGLFVVGGFILFALGLFWIGDRRLLFSDNLEIETRFSHLSGLKVGSKVMVSGMDAGEVLSIAVPPSPAEKFRVRFRVLSRFRPILRTDSVASIQVEELVGNKVLQIDAGTAQTPSVTAGTTLPSREPVEISAVIQQSVDMIRKVGDAVEEIKGGAMKTIDIVAAVGVDARKVVSSVGDDAQEVFGTTKKIAKDIDGVVDGVRKGRGVVGRLLNDDRLYPRIQNTVQQAEMVAANFRHTSDDARKIVADLQSRKLGETVQKTAVNIETATGQVKDVLATLKTQAGSGQRGLLDDVRDALDNTREATADLAENMEAIKRNWFFRGFFNRRGFFDLDSLSRQEYLEGKIAPNRERERKWLSAAELFSSKEGAEALSEKGKTLIDEAMVPYLRYAPNTLLIVEGYATAGAETEQFLASRDRAQLVRRYLLDRFDLKTTFVGSVPMGKTATSAPSGSGFWDGVALVFMPEKPK
jgi:phospholipid/cholesterol/gamma-HCH transport system substrate-binding protein